jgi:hypothetical protein
MNFSYQAALIGRHVLKEHFAGVGHLSAAGSAP